MKHILRALDLAGTALSEGQPIPEQAVRMIAKTTLHISPSGLGRIV